MRPTHLTRTVAYPCMYGGDGRMGWYQEKDNVGRSPCVLTRLIVIVWLNKLLTQHPESLNLSIHDVEDGDHNDL